MIILFLFLLLLSLKGFLVQNLPFANISSQMRVLAFKVSNLLFELSNILRGQLARKAPASILPILEILAAGFGGSHRPGHLDYMACLEAATTISDSCTILRFLRPRPRW